MECEVTGRVHLRRYLKVGALNANNAFELEKPEASFEKDAGYTYSWDMAEGGIVA
jgi:hypothetical protein